MLYWGDIKFILTSVSHHYLIMWHTNGSIKVIKEDAKPFIAISNTVDALFYTEDMGPVAFFGHNHKGRRTSDAMSHRC